METKPVVTNAMRAEIVRAVIAAGPKGALPSEVSVSGLKMT